MTPNNQLITSDFLKKLQVPFVAHPDIAEVVAAFLAAFAGISYSKLSTGKSPQITGVPGVESGIELKGKYSPDVVFGIDNYLSKIRAAPQNQIDALMRPLCQELVGTAWELLKERNLVSRKHPSPAVQFLRHVRNASFHGNKFHFYKGEPKIAAKWRAAAITNVMQGDSVFFKFMNYADALWLTTDVYDEVLGSP